MTLPELSARSFPARCSSRIQKHLPNRMDCIYYKMFMKNDHRITTTAPHQTTGITTRARLSPPPPPLSSRLSPPPPFPRQHDTAKGSSHNGRRRTAPLTYTSPSSSSLTASSGSISCGTSSTTALSSQLVFRVLRFVF